MNTKINKTVIVLMLSLSFSAFSQEKVSIVLLKGMAILQKSPSENIKIGRAEKLIMPINSSIVLSPNSSAIVFNSKAKLEVGSNTEQKLSYSQINASLKKIKPSSLTTNFIIYLDKMYADVEDKNNSYGASIGAASRGIEDDALAYLPIDDTIILSDSLVLSFGSEKTKLTSNIVVTNTTTNEVVYNQKPEINEVKLNGLKPGNYSWEYKIDSNGKNISFKFTFIIPLSIEKEAKLKEIANFKTNLNDCSKSETCLSDSTKEVLLNDFLEKNKYYINK
jgi:hypothetical protein